MKNYSKVMNYCFNQLPSGKKSDAEMNRMKKIAKKALGKEDTYDEDLEDTDLDAKDSDLGAEDSDIEEEVTSASEEVNSSSEETTSEETNELTKSITEAVIEVVNETVNKEVENEVFESEPPKKKRGRPKKTAVTTEVEASVEDVERTKKIESAEAELIKQLEERIKNLEVERKAQNEENERLLNEHEELVCKVKMYKSQSEKSQSEKDKLKAEYQRLESERAEYKSKLEHAESKYEAELEELRAGIPDLTRDIEEKANAILSEYELKLKKVHELPKTNLQKELVKGTSKLAYSEHSLERYALRMANIPQEEISKYTKANRVTITTEIKNMIVKGICIYDGKNTPTRLSEDASAAKNIQIYIYDLCCIIVDKDKNNVVTLYMPSLNVGEGSNRAYINDIMVGIEEKTEKIESLKKEIDEKNMLLRKEMDNALSKAHYLRQQANELDKKAAAYKKLMEDNKGEIESIKKERDTLIDNLTSKNKFIIWCTN